MNRVLRRWRLRFAAFPAAMALAVVGCQVNTASAARETHVAAQSTAALQPKVAPGEYRGELSSGATWLGHVPKKWNGTVLVFNHGYGPLTPQDAPAEATRQELLKEGYALVGSSYSGPSLWAVERAPDDQFAALQAMKKLLGTRPTRTIAIGQSMGGLVSALQAQAPRGQIDGVLTTCGLVSGAVNINNTQVNGLYALSHLLAPDRDIPLVRYRSPEQAAQSAQNLSSVVTDAQDSTAGRARTALGAALLNGPTWFTGDTPPAPHDYAAQESQQFQALVGGAIERFMPGRQQIELVAGGNSVQTRGVDYRALLNSSSHARQVRALYQKAGLDLDADLATLTRDANITADPDALASLTRTSMVTGKVQVPTLSIETIGDQLGGVEQQNWYAKRVARAGDARKLKQAFVSGAGHCRFQSAEVVASLHALEERLDSGRWTDAIRPERLNRAADSLGLGTKARFSRFAPPRLVGGLGEPGHPRE